MWVNVWLFQFTSLQPIDNQHFAKSVKDVGFLYENSRRQENAESMITPPPLITMSGASPRGKMFNKTHVIYQLFLSFRLLLFLEFIILFGRHIVSYSGRDIRSIIPRNGFGHLSDFPFKLRFIYFVRRDVFG